jgi:hypothetical protein
MNTGNRVRARFLSKFSKARRLVVSVLISLTPAEIKDGFPGQAQCQFIRAGDTDQTLVLPRRLGEAAKSLKKGEFLNVSANFALRRRVTYIYPNTPLEAVHCTLNLFMRRICFSSLLASQQLLVNMVLV